MSPQKVTSPNEIGIRHKNIYAPVMTRAQKYSYTFLFELKLKLASIAARQYG